MPAPDSARRQQAREVRCPECGAMPGEPCYRKRGGYRVANHAGRVQARAGPQGR